ncbi:MAG: NUDIX hydrolase [Planctomycetes bacterium]|nr:NUDIX hydrolase [Planctomycetota bacterium]
MLTVFNDLRPVRHAIVALIHDGDDMLLIERAAADTYPGYWSAVTGAMDAGETQQAACIREAREEIGLQVKPVRKVWESVTRRASFVLHWWQCELAGPRAVVADPAEVGDYRWVREADIARIPLMFSDARWFYRDIYPRVRR